MKQPKQAKKIILDSNFLLAPAQFNIDIFEELEKLLNRKLEPLLLSTTIGEIKKLASSNAAKTRKQASVALLLTQKCTVMPVEPLPGESNDDVILRVASKLKCIVATNDRRLRARLREAGVPVVFLRQRTQLEIEGNIE